MASILMLPDSTGVGPRAEPGLCAMDAICAELVLGTLQRPKEEVDGCNRFFDQIFDLICRMLMFFRKEMVRGRPRRASRDPFLF